MESVGDTLREMEGKGMVNKKCIKRQQYRVKTLLTKDISF